MKRSQLPRPIVRELDGLPWRATNGKKHIKVYVGPHLIAILPHGHCPDHSRFVNDIVCRIKRFKEGG